MDSEKLLTNKVSNNVVIYYWRKLTIVNQAGHVIYQKRNVEVNEAETVSKTCKLIFAMDTYYELHLSK